MFFQRIAIALFLLLAVGLGAALYIDWRLAIQVLVEGFVFADAVAACERAPSSTPFKWNSGRNTAVIGLNSVKLDRDTVIASYTLLADNVFCDYDPIKKKADIGSSFLERE